MVSDRTISVVDILPGSAADVAGMEIGDRLLTIDGTAYASGSEARGALAPNEDGAPLSIMIARHGETQTLAVTPMYVAELGRDGVGVAIVETGFVRYPWHEAPGKGLWATVFSTRDVLVGFGGMILGCSAKPMLPRAFLAVIRPYRRYCQCPFVQAAMLS